jgi:periplasmic protein TonB
MTNSQKAFTILLILLAPSVFGQDKNYFSKDGVKLKSKEKADYYELSKVDKLHGEVKEVNAFFISGKKKFSKSEVLTHYSSELLVKAKPMWLLDGKYEEWFENGNVKKLVQYDKGEPVGDLITYWENGAVKRIDKFGKFGKFISGKCYDIAGKEVDFFPFSQPAKFAGGEDSIKAYIIRTVKNYLSDSLKVVNVRFFINTRGAISNVQVDNNNEAGLNKKIENRSFNKKLDIDAVRVISAMPNWIPSLCDGEPSGQWMNLQVVYGKKADQDIKMPSFVGGELAYRKYFERKIRYPVEAQEKGIQGIVLLRFVVTKTGKIGTIEILRSLQFCDDAALKFIQNMPDWTPGKLSGESVDFYITMPLSFILE